MMISVIGWISRINQKTIFFFLLKIYFFFNSIYPLDLDVINFLVVTFYIGAHAFWNVHVCHALTKYSQIQLNSNVNYTVDLQGIFEKPDTLYTKDLFTSTDTVSIKEGCLFVYHPQELSASPQRDTADSQERSFILQDSYSNLHNNIFVYKVSMLFCETVTFFIYLVISSDQSVT